MFTYKLTFDNGAKFISKGKNLDVVHTKIVNYIEKNNLKECIILCPNNVTRRVRKTGSYHWNHNGYSFD
jgi:hypothetical protein